MASYSTDTEGLILSTHQGLDRCASLLKALLSPQLSMNSTHNSNNKTTSETSRHQVLSLMKKNYEQTSSSSSKRISQNGGHNNTSSIPYRRQLPNKDNMKRSDAIKKTKRKGKPLPVAVSTPRDNSINEEYLKETSLHHGGIMMDMGSIRHQSLPLMDGACHDNGQSCCHRQPLLWPPWLWLPPYHVTDTMQPHNDITSKLERELVTVQESLKELHSALDGSNNEVMRLNKIINEKEKFNNLQNEEIDKLKSERDKLSVEISKLKTTLEESEATWNKKHQIMSVETDQVRQELYEENQMLKLSLAEKETELLQSQDNLLGIRQCLAHLLINIKPSTNDSEHSLLPKSELLKLQSIVNTGLWIDKTDSNDRDITGNDGDITDNDVLDVTLTQSSVMSWDGKTTTTEVDFRHDLAALDEDIARLQIQFDIGHINND